MPRPRTEDLCALIDQALPHASATALHHHLQTCPVCAQQLQSLRSQRASLQALPLPVLDAQFGQRLQSRFPPHAAACLPQRPLRGAALRTRWRVGGLGAHGPGCGRGRWGGRLAGAMLLGAARSSPVRAQPWCGYLIRCPRRTVCRH